MLSRKVGMMDKVKGRMAGASDYIAKPFAAGDIIGAAEKYVS
jgi:twitching motility two-component system response regulator PilG